MKFYKFVPTSAIHGSGFHGGYVHCERGQKVQNSMNGALIEQGILNIEIDPEAALKKFGLRDKSKKKEKGSVQNNSEDIIKRIKMSSEIGKR